MVGVGYQSGSGHSKTWDSLEVFLPDTLKLVALGMPAFSFTDSGHTDPLSYSICIQCTDAFGLVPLEFFFYKCCIQSFAKRKMYQVVSLKASTGPNMTTSMSKNPWVCFGYLRLPIAAAAAFSLFKFFFKKRIRSIGVR
jgi:hypothetical protein